jgi:hypothetical protein
MNQRSLPRKRSSFPRQEPESLEHLVSLDLDLAHVPSGNDLFYQYSRYMLGIPVFNINLVVSLRSSEGMMNVPSGQDTALSPLDDAIDLLSEPILYTQDSALSLST